MYAEILGNKCSNIDCTEKNNEDYDIFEFAHIRGDGNKERCPQNRKGEFSSQGWGRRTNQHLDAAYKAGTLERDYKILCRNCHGRETRRLKHYNQYNRHTEDSLRDEINSQPMFPFCS
jgi:hypothetical protein